MSSSSSPLVGVATSSSKRKSRKSVSFRSGLKKGIIGNKSTSGAKGSSVLTSRVKTSKSINTNNDTTHPNENKNNNDSHDGHVDVATNDTKQDDISLTTTPSSNTRKQSLLSSSTNASRSRSRYGGNSSSGSSINKIIPGGGKRKSRGSSIVTLGANRTSSSRVVEDDDNDLPPPNNDNDNDKNVAEVDDVKSKSSTSTTNNTTLQHALSSTFSSSVGYIRNNNDNNINNSSLGELDKQKDEMTTTSTMDMPEPYQFLGKLDPSWNIPAPKTGELTMKDFCVNPRRKRTKRKNTNNYDKNKQQMESSLGLDEVTSVVTSASSVKVDKVINSSANHHDDNMDNMSTNSSGQKKNDGPAVEIINGEIVIKQSSITINARKTTKEIDEEYLNDENALVVEDNNRGVINATYRSFLKEQPKSGHWTPKETHKFYNVLRQCGTDFSMMTSFFSNRNRRQLKKKYLIETRKNPKLIDMAMNPNSHLPVDTSVFGELDMTNVTDVKAIADHQISSSPHATNVDPSSAPSSKIENNDNEKNGGDNEDQMELVIEGGDGDTMNRNMNVKTQKDDPEQQQSFSKQQTMEDLFNESEINTNVDPSESNNDTDPNKVKNEAEKDINGLKEEEETTAPMTLTLMGGGNKSKKAKSRPKFKVKAKRPVGGPNKSKQRKR